MTSEMVTYPEFLRLLAEFIERNPTLPQPTLYSFIDGASFQLDTVTAKAQLCLIGDFQKEFIANSFRATKLIGGRKVEFWVGREAVCKKTITGTKIVPEHYVEGKAGYIEPEHEEEIVEWDCSDPILSASEVGSAVLVPDED